MAPMTARGQRSQGVIKGRGLLPQPLELYFQVIISKMKKMGCCAKLPTQNPKLPSFLQNSSSAASDSSRAHPATHVVHRSGLLPWKRTHPRITQPF